MCELKRPLQLMNNDDKDDTNIDLNLLPTYLPNTKRHQSNPVNSISEYGGSTTSKQTYKSIDNAKIHTSSGNKDKEIIVNEVKEEIILQQVSKDHESKNKKTDMKVPVFGTRILLETEEDIKKWIKERKKNYPTNKKIQEKKEQQQQNKTSLNNNKKANSKRVNDNSKSRSKTNSNTKVISLIPQGNSRNLQNGRIREFNGIKVFIPSRFNNTFVTSKEKKNFSNRLNARDNFAVNNKILDFIEDIVNNNLFDINNAYEKIKDKS